MGPVRDDNVVRASYAGDATTPPTVTADVQVELVRRAARLTLTGPSRVVDEREVALVVRWRADDGTPVAGEVRLQQRRRGGWRTIERPVTDATGTATVRLRPRTDAVLRVSAPALDWVEATRSGWKRIDNVPPVAPVRLSRAAPRPRRHLPPQERARGAGAAPVVSRHPRLRVAGDGGPQLARGLPRRSRRAAAAAGQLRRLLRLPASRRAGGGGRGCGPVRRGVHRAPRPPDPDPLDVPRGPLRLVVTAAGRRRPGLDGLRQHLGVQLPRRGGPPGRAVAALLRPRPRPQPVGEPLPRRRELAPQRLVARRAPTPASPGAARPTRSCRSCAGTASRGPTASRTPTTSTPVRRVVASSPAAPASATEGRSACGEGMHAASVGVDP